MEEQKSDWPRSIPYCKCGAKASEHECPKYVQAICSERDAALFQVRDLREWARERGREHHNIAVEKRGDDELLTQHNSLSSAYFRLADEIERRAAEKRAEEQPKKRGCDCGATVAFPVHLPSCALRAEYR